MAESTHYWRGICSGFSEKALFVVFNNDAYDSGSRVHVQKMAVNPICSSLPRSTGPFMAYQSLVKITALSGGFSVDTVKAASASANLPAGVVVSRYCDSVTYASSVYRHAATRGPRFINPSWAPFNEHFGNGISPASPFRPSGLWEAGYVTLGSDGVIEGLKLAEGEGLALADIDDTGASNACRLGVTGALRVGSETHYLCTEVSRAYPGMAMLGIMNNVGSGVTVEVVYLQLHEVGWGAWGVGTQAEEYRQHHGWRASKVFGYDGGIPVTWTDMSSASAAPAGLVLVTNRGMSSLNPVTVDELYGPSKDALGYPQSGHASLWPMGTYTKQIYPVFASVGPGNAVAGLDSSTHYGPRGGPTNGFALRRGELDGIVLEPGEGLAIISGSNATENIADIEITVNYEAPAAPSSGSGMLVHPGMSGGMRG